MLWFLTIFLYKSIHVGLVNDLQAFDDNICHRILWTKNINLVSDFPFKKWYIYVCYVVVQDIVV